MRKTGLSATVNKIQCYSHKNKCFSTDLYKFMFVMKCFVLAEKL